MYYRPEDPFLNLKHSKYMQYYSSVLDFTSPETLVDLGRSPSPRTMPGEMTHRNVLTHENVMILAIKRTHLRSG